MPDTVMGAPPGVRVVSSKMKAELGASESNGVAVGRGELWTCAG